MLYYPTSKIDSLGAQQEPFEEKVLGIDATGAEIHDEDTVYLIGNKQVLINNLEEYFDLVPLDSLIKSKYEMYDGLNEEVYVIENVIVPENKFMYYIENNYETRTYEER